MYNEGTETYWPMNGGKRLTSRYEYLKSDVNAIRLIDQAPEKEGYREGGSGLDRGEKRKKKNMCISMYRKIRRRKTLYIQKKEL